MENTESMVEQDKRRWWSNFGCSGTVSRSDAKALSRINAIFLTWAFIYAGFILGWEWIRETIGAGVWLVAAVPMALLGWGILTYARFLSHADELTRKIQLEAMATGFGASVFLLFAYDTAQRLAGFEIDLGDLTVMLVVVYVVAILLAQKRYR